MSTIIFIDFWEFCDIMVVNQLTVRSDKYEENYGY